MFGCEFLSIQWIIVALETATKLGDLQGISIYVPSLLTSIAPGNEEFNRTAEEQARRSWSDLDPLLVQFWKSHSIRTKILHPRPSPENQGSGVMYWYKHLLPESTERGIIDLAERT